MKPLVLIPGFILEIFIELYYLWFLFEPRWEKKKTIAIYFILQIINSIRCYFMFDRPMLKSVISVVYVLVLISVLFKDKWTKKVVCFIVYWLCNFLAEATVFLVMRFSLGYESMVIKDLDSVEFLIGGISTYVLMFIYNIVGILLLKKRKINYTEKVIQYLFLYIAVQALVVSVFSTLIYEYDLVSAFIVSMVILVILASVAIGVLLYFAIKKFVSSQSEHKFLIETQKLKDAHFTDLKSQYESFRRLKHDFLNHIKVIDEMACSEKLKNYVGELKNQFEAIDNISFCDNPAVDALISLKYNDAVKSGIKVTIKICDMKNISIRDFDLCTVLANLIDNACEAALKTQEKYIDLTITKKLGNLLIVIKNSSLPVEKGMKTTKKNKTEHGLGLETVRRTAREYGGSVSFKYSDGEFTSIVSMKL